MFIHTIYAAMPVVMGLLWIVHIGITYPKAKWYHKLRKKLLHHHQPTVVRWLANRM